MLAMPLTISETLVVEMKILRNEEEDYHKHADDEDSDKTAIADHSRSILKP